MIDLEKIRQVRRLLRKLGIPEKGYNLASPFSQPRWGRRWKRPRKLGHLSESEDSVQEPRERKWGY